MKGHYELLKKMQARPVLWTGENSLQSIRTFLDGYSLALNEYKIPNKSDDVELNFHNWIAKKLGFFESTAGWQNMILAVTLGLNPKKIKWEDYDSKVTKQQHEKSIQKFYEMLEEYVNEQTN